VAGSGGSSGGADALDQLGFIDADMVALLDHVIAHMRPETIVGRDRAPRSPGEGMRGDVRTGWVS
jgi:hypothetical protein